MMHYWPLSNSPWPGSKRHLPDKALDLIDEACALARIPTLASPADRSRGLIVTAQAIAEVLAGWLGVPVESLRREG